MRMSMVMVTKITNISFASALIYSTIQYSVRLSIETDVTTLTKFPFGAFKEFYRMKS